jgi:hypothetical protein
VSTDDNGPHYATVPSSIPMGGVRKWGESDSTLIAMKRSLQQGSWPSGISTSRPSGWTWRAGRREGEPLEVSSAAKVARHASGAARSESSARRQLRDDRAGLVQAVVARQHRRELLKRPGAVARQVVHSSSALAPLVESHNSHALDYRRA